MLWVFLQVKTVFNALNKKTANDVQERQLRGLVCGTNGVAAPVNRRVIGYYSAKRVAHA